MMVLEQGPPRASLSLSLGHAARRRALVSRNMRFGNDCKAWEEKKKKEEERKKKEKKKIKYLPSDPLLLLPPPPPSCSFSSSF